MLDWKNIPCILPSKLLSCIYEADVQNPVKKAKPNEYQVVKDVSN